MDNWLRTFPIAIVSWNPLIVNTLIYQSQGGLLYQSSTVYVYSGTSLACICTRLFAGYKEIIRFSVDFDSETFSLISKNWLHNNT